MFVQLDNVFLYGFVVLLFNALHIQRNGQYKHIVFLTGIQIDRAFVQGCQRTCQRQADAYSITGHRMKWSLFSLPDRTVRIYIG